MKGKKPRKKTPTRETFVMKSGSGGLMTIRSGDWKFIEGKGSGGFSGRVRGGDPLAAGGSKKRAATNDDEPPAQLYMMSEDIGETTNLYTRNPEVVSQLREQLAEIVNSDRSR